jgi:flagellar protein FliS
MQNQAAAVYRNQEVLTASPAQLVAMLYERAMRALRDAIRAIEAGDIEARWKQNNLAIDIITHMWGTLDMERGGEMSSNLSNLYRFMLKRLADVDAKNDPKAAQDVIGLIEPLHASWRQLAAQIGTPQAAATAPRPAPAVPGRAANPYAPAAAGGMRFSA